MAVLQITVFVAFVSCFLSFLWAMSGGFFRVVGTVPGGTRVIQVVGLPWTLTHAAALLSASDLAVVPGLVGLVLYSLSLVLFWSAIRVNRQQPLSLAFSSDRPEHLVTSGPYRYMRHPFYASYTLAWLAGVIASQQAWLTLSLGMMGMIYYTAARMEERKFAGSALAAEYQRYRARVGMFFPLPPVHRRLRSHEGERA